MLLSVIRLLGVGCRPSMFAEADIHAEIAANVSNRMNTSHSSASMPPAAKAEEETVGVLSLNFRFVSKSALRERQIRAVKQKVKV